MRKLFYGITKMWGVSSELGRYRIGSEMQNVDSFSSAWMMVEDGLIVGLGGSTEQVLNNSNNSVIIPFFDR